MWDEVHLIHANVLRTISFSEQYVLNSQLLSCSIY